MLIHFRSNPLSSVRPYEQMSALCQKRTFKLVGMASFVIAQLSEFHLGNVKVGL